MRSNLRLCAVLIAVVSVASAYSQTSVSFPAALAPELPVSGFTPVPSGSVFSSVHAASNGDVTLVAWMDNRAGVLQACATRVDAQGNVLDPLGIPISQSNGPDDVIWNGHAFAVFSHTYNTVEFTFIDPDGTVIDRRSRAALKAIQYAGSSGRGAATRLLFVSQITGVPITMTVLDGESYFVAQSTVDPSRLATFVPVAFAGDDSGFLVLQAAAPYSSRNMSSLRFDREGSLTSAIDSAFSMGMSMALRAGGNGFLLVVRGASNTYPQGWWLDQNGAVTGSQVAFGTPTFESQGYRPSIGFDGTQFIVAWHFNHADGSSEVLLARATPGAATGSARTVATPAGAMSAVALPADLGTRLLFFTPADPGSGYFNLYVQRFTTALEVSTAQLATTAAPRQTNVHVAASRTTYAVTWCERRSDGSIRGYIRRFASSGAPIDPEPLEVMQLPASSTDPLMTVASTRNGVCAVMWSDGQFMRVRRLGIDSDGWLDDVPLAIAPSSNAALESNGSDFLAVGTDSSGAIIAERIPSDRLTPRSTPVTVTTGIPLDTPVLASDGSNYLLVWSERTVCPTLCPVGSPNLWGMHLRADGTPIDASPLAIDGSNLGAPSVAWNAGKYIVVWASDTLTSTDVRGATITAGAGVGSVDPSRGGTVLQSFYRYAGVTPLITAYRDGFALLTETQAQGERTAVWRGLTFSGTSDLAALPAEARATLFDPFSVPYGSLDVAATGGTLMLAYSRPAGPEAGGGPRAFTRTFASLPPRHRIVAH